MQQLDLFAQDQKPETKREKPVKYNPVLDPANWKSRKQKIKETIVARSGIPENKLTVCCVGF